jgi:hypothetical protein
MTSEDRADPGPEPEAAEGAAEDAAPEGAGAARRAERVHLALGLVLPAILLVVNMVRVGPFTIDDAYISFRYARNLARGLGLVYNPGEHIEGYTNFFWTVLLAGGVKVGLDPVLLAKVLGGLAACGSLVALWLLSRRLRPYGGMPCVATWLFATSIVEGGYAVFGLETPLFVLLILAGTELVFRERDRGSGFPWSGVVFGVAGVTRTAPEAAMFLGLVMLFLGLRFFGKQNLLRGVVFLAPVTAHTLFRHAYYGTWLPNTALAKLGNLSQQIAGGKHYLTEYAQHAWPLLLLALFGLCVAVMARQREALCFAVVAIAVTGYVLVVGGDWMPYFRFMAPFEPFAFLLACLGARSLLDPVVDRLVALGSTRGVLARGLAVAAGLLAAAGLTSIGVFRMRRFNEAGHKLVTDDKVFWDSASGGAAAWFAAHGQPGEIAVADIGYIGYATDYPVLDLLGLVDPVISRLPGGYTNKTGPGYIQRVFDVAPRYFVLVGNATDCNKLPFAAQERLRTDRRFRGVYDVAGMIRHSKGGYWCIFERRADAPPVVR